jgi:predicted ester cyclase
MGNIAATGKSIEVRAVAIVELKGEKARSQRQFFDMATLLQQIGLKWTVTGAGSSS